jgi:CsoR family transcriptional regulator, copper-sensing transcriptional repressor
MAVQGEVRDEVTRRLNRIEGQVRGIRRLVEEETYCVDVLTQIASIHEALRGVGKIIMRDHLEHCVTDALRADDPEKAEKTYRELMDVVYKYAR